MPDTFNCPDCGAPLDYKGSDPIIRCPYCNTSVIVPDNLRSNPVFSSQPHNFTLNGLGGMGDMNAMVKQALRLKEVKELALAGKMVEAERLYSEITGADSATAATAVEALARGMPVMLSNLSTSQVTSSVNVAKEPLINNIPYNPPVDEKTARKTSRQLGCGIGCFVVGLVAFILIVTLVPTLGAFTGVMVGLNPKLVLTVMPTVPELSTALAIQKTVVPSLATVVPSFATQELSFGGEGSGPGLFNDMRAIAVDSKTGKIFTADYGDGRIQVFDPQGKFITQWIVEGKDAYIQSIAAGRNGNVYVPVFGKILVYNADGKLLSTIKPASLKDNYEEIALMADDSLMVVSQGENIVHLSSAGKVLSRVDAAISSNGGDTELSARVAVDGLNNIYLLGSFNSGVYVFNSKGKFTNHFGSDGDEPGQFRGTSAIAVDGKGRIFISDSKGVQVFSNDGRYINVIKVEYFAYNLTFDDQGKLYLSTNQHKAEKYNIPQ
jgi:DNA-binding beta-propeller fold protein YncE